MSIHTHYYSVSESKIRCLCEFIVKNIVIYKNIFLPSSVFVYRVICSYVLVYFTIKTDKSRNIPFKKDSYSISSNYDNKKYTFI